MCCNALQCVAVCCNALQCVAVCCNALQCVAVCCNVLQCVAMCCSVLQCVAVCWRERWYCSIILDGLLREVCALRALGAATPSTQSNLFPKVMSFFHVETHKVSTSIRGGFTFYYTSHVMKKFIPHFHRARSLNGFKIGSNLAENTIDRIRFDDILRWKFHFFLSEPFSVRFAWDRFARFARDTVKWLLSLPFHKP